MNPSRYAANHVYFLVKNRIGSNSEKGFKNSAHYRLETYVDIPS
jgi:hypothetical protein